MDPAEGPVHTRRQRLVRLLFRFFGPAQVGLPPYATPEERESFARDRAARDAPVARPEQPPLPGYRMVSYVDEHGVRHSAAVPEDRTTPTDPPSPD